MRFAAKAVLCYNAQGSAPMSNVCVSFALLWHSTPGTSRVESLDEGKELLCTCYSGTDAMPEICDSLGHFLLLCGLLHVALGITSCDSIREVALEASRA